MTPLSSLRPAMITQLRPMPMPQAGEGLSSARLMESPEMRQITTQPPATSQTAATGDGSFSGMLGQFVQEVSGKQAAAGEAVNGLMSGQNVSLHQAMISMEEASVSFQLMVEVRNKLLESYQEMMRMQI